jgi:hypothetical protein
VATAQKHRLQYHAPVGPRRLRCKHHRSRIGGAHLDRHGEFLPGRPACRVLRGHHQSLRKLRLTACLPSIVHWQGDRSPVRGEWVTPSLRPCGGRVEVMGEPFRKMR